MKHIVNPGRLFAVAMALIAAPAFAASSVSVTWQGADLNGTRMSTMDTTVSSTQPVTSDYWTTALNYTYTGTANSFVAYCIEPSQQNGRAGIARDYALESFSGAQAKLLQGLYATEYASLSNYNDKAAFQLAIWEIVRETGSALDVTSGSFHVLGSDATVNSISQLANSFLGTASSYVGPDRYTLVKLTNASLQDLVVAAPLTAVPEPETYALLLAGLGIVGLKVRRRASR